MNPSALDDDTVTYEELYQSYVNFWNSLNNCLEDEDKMIPANGIKPTYQEAKQLWKSMKIPRRRKLLWIATGFIHSEFPDDEEAFRREKAEGLINETNVTTGANAEDESSDDDYDPDLDEENIASADNVNGDNDAVQRGTPLSITQATAAAGTADSIPPVISPIQSQMNSINISSAADAGSAINETISDSQPDAWVETVQEDDDVQDHDMEESDINSPQSPAQANENDVTAASQVSNESDSSVYPLSQTITKQNTPKRNRVIISESDDENNADDGVKDKDIETSYMDEQIASPSEESSSSPTVQRRASKSSGKAVTKRRRKSYKPSTSSQSRTILTRSATREITNQNARKLVTKRGRRSDPENDENILSDSDDNQKRKTLIQSLCNSLDAKNYSGSDESDESSSSSDTRSHGYIVDDNKTDEESFDEDVTYSDSQQNPHSDDTSSFLNDEIYTLDDSVDRDLPTAPPKAIVRNTPTTTQKTTPLLAHVGKSRYASDIPITPARPSLATPSSTKSLQSRTITAPQHEAATPNSSTAVAPGFGQVHSVDPNHIRPQTSEAAAGRIRTRSNKRQQAPADTPQNQLKTHARTPEHQPASSMTSQTSTKKPPVSCAAPVDTRRPTSSVRLGSLICDGLDNSQPSSVNSMNSSVREGYELIENDCKLFIANANTLIIIYLRNGKKHFRRYRPLGSGKYNGENACNDFLCTKCEKLGKSTFVKILKRNNKTYAEIDHAVGCEIREYNLDDD